MTDEYDDTYDSEWEALTGAEVEDALIATYVPEASHMSREDALALALQRDEEYAEQFVSNPLSEHEWEMIDEMRKSLLGSWECQDEYYDDTEVDYGN